MRPHRPRFMAVLATVVALVTLFVVSPAAAEESVEVGGTITGTVTGPDGAILSGESVNVYLQHSYQSIKSTSTDPATGSYAIAGIKPGAYKLLFQYWGDRGLVGEWWSDAYVKADAPEIEVVAGEVLTLDAQLERGAIVRGTLSGSGPGFGQDEYGPPTASAQLVPRESEAPGARTVTVDADGSFTSSPLAPGTYRFWFHGGPRWTSEDHNGERFSYHPVGEPLVLEAGETVDLEVVLDPRPVLAGKAVVADGAEVEPYNGRVIATRTGDGLEASTVSKADGGWEIIGLEPGDYTVRFEADRSELVVPAEWRSSPDEASPSVVTVAEETTVSGIDFTLQRGGAFEGSLHTRYWGSAATNIAWHGEFSIWRLDEERGDLVPITSNEGVGYAGRVRSPVLAPGRYVLYTSSKIDSWAGGEYWEDARYLADSTELVVEPGTNQQLGEIVLDNRYFDVGRLGGADRFEAAVTMSRAAYPDEALASGDRPSVVYIANGLNFPDALAAGPAASLDAGVLLTVTPDAVPKVVEDELGRLSPARIVVVGGPGSVGEGVMSVLRRHVDTPSQVVRVGGADRYETGRNVIRSTFDHADAAFIATGRNYPDALAAGPAAARLGGPVILVDGLAGGIDDTTRDLMDELGIEQVYIAGGEAAVAPAVEAALVDLLGSGNVIRFAGADRFDVAAAVNREIFGQSDYALVASGFGFADALAGGPLASLLSAPMHLATPECIPAAAADHMIDADVAGVMLLGGPGALHPSVEELTICG